ncbi:DNA-binding transcriptional ArsR family regulator [Rhodococcus sp. 27YEA15]|uniref:ArsR/SmtB family transcription factor n=1 Tax=Rhodococcus sp. 27YEA15 TaxID=3156259 RepID=UPI003C7E543C
MAIPDKSQIRFEEILSALGHPVRLAILAALADNQQHRCGALVTGVSKSTLTHHWRVLRDAGVIDQEPSGRENLLSLRRNDIESRFPGFLPTVLAALATDSVAETTIGAYLPDPPTAVS